MILCIFKIEPDAKGAKGFLLVEATVCFEENAYFLLDPPEAGRQD